MTLLKISYTCVCVVYMYIYTYTYIRLRKGGFLEIIRNFRCV